MVFFKNNPFVRLLIPLVLGILFQYYFGCPLSVSLILFVITFICWLLINRFKNAYHNRYWNGLLLNFMIILLGLVITAKNSTNLNTNNNKVMLAGIILKPLEKSNKHFKTEIKISASKQNGIWKEYNKTVAAYFNDSLCLKLKAGNQIIFNSKLNAFNKRLNPFGFDYAKYMEIKNISNAVYLNNTDWFIQDKNHGNLKTKALILREKIILLYESNNISDNNLAVLSALTLGYKNNLDEKVKAAFRGAGATHILAVSGMHVAIIFGILRIILLVIPFKKLRSVIIIISLWVYVFLSGLSPSVMRAVIMFTFISFGGILNKRIGIYNSLAASAFLLLLINPYYLFQVGFQLSYIAVAGIVFFYPKINGLFYARIKIIRWAWSLTSVSIAAQLVTFPVTSYHFNQFPTYFWLSNIGVTLLAMLLLVLSFILIFTSGFAIFAKAIAVVINKAINVNMFFLNWINDLPGAVISNINISTLQLYLLYSILIGLTAWLIKKHYRSLLISMLLILGFAVSNLINVIKTNKQQAVCVYHRKNESAIQFITGNKTIWFNSQSLNKNHTYNFLNDANLFWHCKNTSTHNIDSINSNTYVNDFFYSSQGFWNMNSAQGLIINSNTYLPPTPKDSLKLNYLIVTGSPTFSLADLSKKISFNTIIIDGSVPRWKTMLFKPISPFTSIHYTKNNGAFISSEK